ncbi:putative F-box-like domain superfamily protein [Helianthus anomalus]
MVYIHFDIILFEILIRLNGRSIDQYKCVCKQWNEGLSSWSFEWLYVNYANAYLVIYYSFLLLNSNFKLLLLTLFLFYIKIICNLCTRESFWEDCPTLYGELYKEYFPPESKRNKNRRI